MPKRTDADEIEVTKSMIEAGVQALGEGTLKSIDEEDTDDAIREDVTRIYRAMRSIAIRDEATKIALSLSKQG